MTVARLRAALARRWWVIPASIVGVVVVLALVDTATSSSSAVAETVLVVPAGSTADDPGRATEAIDLATTYMRLIPEDRGVIDAVAATVGTKPTEAASRMSAFADSGTSLVRLRYRGAGERQALAGSRRMATAVSGANPAAASVEANFLRLVRPARIVGHPSAGVGAATVAVGSFLGLCLGLVLLLFWERVDPRVDSVDDLIDAFDVPAVELSALTAEGVPPLLGRWRELSAEGQDEPGGVIGLLASTVRSEPLVEPVAARLDRVVVRRDAGPRLVKGPAPGITGIAEAVARSTGTVVLVVARGDRLADVRRAVKLLSEYGTYVAWFVFADSVGAPSPDASEATPALDAVAPAQSAVR